MPDITLQPVSPAQVDDVVAFVDTARRALFPALADAPLPADLAHFGATYLEGEGHFIVACNGGQLIGAIGYLPYDHRFPQLDYRNGRTVEVVRLFVAPAYRRGGLASRLFAALRAHALAAGVERLYLHTHPFLPGAIRFWERQGFHVVDVERDLFWQTTHMQATLRGNA